MKTPSIGQLILARHLLTTGDVHAGAAEPKRRPLFFHLGEIAVVLTFVYFLFM